VSAQTSRAWADGDGQAFAAWYAPGATVILPAVYQAGQDAIREAIAAAFARPLKNTRLATTCSRSVTPTPGTAIVITDRVTVPPGEPQPAARQRERATWVLSRSELAQLRQQALYRLMERHQLQDPFRFLIYAELAGAEIGPVAAA
jgi:uncharacterized protein (TIGR02246 family)